MPNLSVRPLPLALFDCDGTLVDSQHAIIAAMTTAWNSCGLGAPDANAVRRVVGLPLVNAVAHLLPDLPPGRHDEIAERYKEAFRDQRARGDCPEPLYPGVRAALDALDAAGVLLGVATGKGRRGLVATLEHHDLLDRFVTLQTADVGPGKPHPDMVFRALAEVGAVAEGTVVIGDTVYDMQMARNARVGAIGVTWGYHERAELAAAGAQVVCRDYDEVPSAVAAVLAALEDLGIPA